MINGGGDDFKTNSLKNYGESLAGAAELAKESINGGGDNFKTNSLKNNEIVSYL